MNRFRACLFALLASTLVATAARAATIEVTTTEDVVQDNDDLCSLREAVVASQRAGKLSVRKSALNSSSTNIETLDEALVILRRDPDDTYQNVRLVPMLQVVRDALLETEEDLQELLPLPVADLARIDALLRADPNPNPPAPPGPPYPPTYDPSKDPYASFADDNGIIPMIEYLNAASSDFRDSGVPIVERVRELIEESQDILETEVDRLNLADEVDGCDDGSFFDTITLEEDTYTLANELPIEVRVTLRGVPGKSFIEPEPLATTRLIVIPESYTVEIHGVVLRNGDAGAGNGGALLVEGTGDLIDVVFEDNRAANGGAIWVEDNAVLTVEQGTFRRNEADDHGGAIGGTGRSISVEVGRFGETPADANVADADGDTTGNGGAIWFEPSDDGGTLSVSRATFIGNQARAGAGIWAASTQTLNLGVENVTFGQNVNVAGAALHVAAGDNESAYTINNITVVENDGGTLTGGILLAGSPRLIEFWNSVVSDNISAGVSASWDADCDVSAIEVPTLPPALQLYSDAFSAYFQRNFYAFGSLCPGFRVGGPAVDSTNYELASGDTALGYLLQPLDVDDGYYVPRYMDDYTDNAEVRLVNRGASTQEEFRCATTDQRGLQRASFVDAECDVGAIEYQIGRRADNFDSMVVNTPTCVDVLADDRGDAEYTPGTLEILDIERPGARAVVAAADPAQFLTDWIAAYGTRPPPQVVDRATCPNIADLLLEPSLSDDLILYTPARGFAGETNVTYQFQWRTANVGNPASGAVSAIAHMGTEPARGLTSSSGGTFGPWAVLLSALLALRRRRLAAPLSGLLALGAISLPLYVVSAQENIIYVNTEIDQYPVTQAGDGLCTLREALNTARNDQANLTRGDCLNGNEGPDFIEFTEDVNTVTLQGKLDAWGGVTLRCPEPVPTDTDPNPPQQICTIARSPTAPTQFRLIESYGSLSLIRMRLQGGDPGLNQPGGAISSTGGVSVNQSTFTDNTADSGGAIYLAGIRGDLVINNSHFEGNVSTGTASSEGGGALAVSNADQHTIRVTGSTFVRNEAARSGGAILVSGNGSSVIVNSTFEDNVGWQGAGAIDAAQPTLGATLRNLTVVNNRSAYPTGALHAGTRGAVLVNSIVAANYDIGVTRNTTTPPSGQDANCSGNLAFTNNLFGESAGRTTCTPDTYDLVQADTAVYNLSGTGFLRPLADPEDATPPYDPYKTPPEADAVYHLFNSPGALTGIIVDAGYDSDLADDDPDLTPALAVGAIKCADVDQRGESRQSGGRCDIGAVEWVQTTAVADSGSNAGRGDRLVVIDVLANDVVDETNECVPAVIDNSTPGRARLRAAPALPTDPPLSGLLCADVQYSTGKAEFIAVVDDPDEEDPDFKLYGNRDDGTGYPYGDGDEVPGQPLPTASDFVLLYDNLGTMVRDISPLELNYNIFGQDGVPSNTATISITIGNAAPALEEDIVRVAVGERVVIRVLDNDEDPDYVPGNDVTDDADKQPDPVLTSGGLNPATLRISSSNCQFQLANTWNCQFGTATVDTVAGTITWAPYNSFNPFTETFTYEVEDYAVLLVPGDGAVDSSLDDLFLEKTASANVTIRMDRPVENGGAILGDDDLSDMLGIDFLGATGQLFLGVLTLLGLRRRRA